MAPTTDQPNKGPEAAPQPSEVKSDQEKARLELEAKQKAETAQVSVEHSKQQTETVNAAAAARADMMAEMPTPPANAPTAAPTSAPADASGAAKGFGDTFKDFFGKFKEFFGTIGTKLSEFFNKIFGKKPEQASVAPPPSNIPAPAPGVTPPSGPPPTPQNTPKVSAEVLDGSDTTVGLKGAALLNNPQFQARTDQIANNLGVSRADLYGIFKMEGVTPGIGVDPAAVNPTSKAVGLIQWLPRYLPKGVSFDDMKNMSGLKQLDYVEKHFLPYKGKLRTFADLYRVVFYPASLGKGPDYVFGGAGTESAKQVAKQNSGIAKYSNRPDGLIDNNAFERYANSKRPSDSSLMA